MLRVIAFILLSLPLAAQDFGQGRANPQEAPINVATNAFWKAQNEGRFADAVAQREEARRLLAKAAPDDPRFANWVESLARIYQNAGMAIDARAIVEGGLDRAAVLVASHPARIALLNLMSDFWQQDRNPLKSLVYLEKAVAALELGKNAPQAGPTPGAALGNTKWVRSAAFVSGNRVTFLNSPGVYDGQPRADSQSFVYQRLADLYRRLGRPDAARDTLAKMAALATTDEARASMAEQTGQFEEAAALYKKIAETQPVNVPGPWAQVNALQSLARMYQNNQEYDKAAAALNQTILVLNNSGMTEAGNQVSSVRQNLAHLYQQAGNLEAAEQTYQQSIAQAPAEMRFQMLSGYATFLGSTKRAGQGEQLLRDYMDSGAIKQPWEESNVWMMLAQLARQGGDPKRGDEYQSMATAKQQAMQTRDNVDRVTIQPLLQKAQAAGAGHPEDAFALALEAMRQATPANDRESVVHFVSSLASSLANKNFDKAQQLFDRLLVLVDGWMEQTRNPSLTARQQYVRFLFRPGHWEQAGDAIASYRETLIASHGEGTGWMEEVLNLTVDLERGRNSGKALPAARELLALEESLAGKTSEPCLRGLEVLANVTEQTDDPASALEARAMGRELRPPQPDLFHTELEHIQRRKAALAQQR